MTSLSETLSLPVEIRNLVTEFKEETAVILGGDLDRVILYGSYARGDYDPESDVDVIILLTKPIHTEKKSAISDLVFRYLIDKGLLFSIIYYET